VHTNVGSCGSPRNRGEKGVKKNGPAQKAVTYVPTGWLGTRLFSATSVRSTWDPQRSRENSGSTKVNAVSEKSAEYSDEDDSDEMVSSSVNDVSDMAESEYWESLDSAGDGGR
jgi:hypothetical protein